MVQSGDADFDSVGAYAAAVDSRASRLYEALVSAFGPFVATRLEELGADPADFETVVQDTAARLRRGLESLLEEPFASQQEAPLEVMRDCLQLLTAALREAGVEAPARDAGQEEVAPDDPYDLGPASAAELGEEALQASLAWGAAKAADVARPLALVVSANLMDLTRIEEGARAAGYRVATAKPGSMAADAVVAFVDLTETGADEAVSALAQAGVKVVAYGPHVDDVAMLRARALGASVAEPRSRVLRDPASFLPPLV